MLIGATPFSPSTPFQMPVLRCTVADGPACNPRRQVARFADGCSLGGNGREHPQRINSMLRLCFMTCIEILHVECSAMQQTRVRRAADCVVSQGQPLCMHRDVGGGAIGQGARSPQEASVGKNMLPHFINDRTWVIASFFASASISPVWQRPSGLWQGEAESAATVAVATLARQVVPLTFRSRVRAQ